MYLFKCLAKQYNDQKPFAVYRKPNSTTAVGLFQKTYALCEVETFEEQGFIFAPFAEGKRFYIPLAESAIIKETLNEATYELADVVLDYKNKEAKEAFEDLVTRCVNAIKDKKFGKVVPSRKESLSYQVEDLGILFQKLCSTYPTAFCSLVYHPQIGLWMGATPETLLAVNGNNLKTMALAGTQVNHGQEKVEWGIKEQEEQLFVTDFITDTLKPFSSDITTSEPYSKRAAKVMHICTDITATLKDNNLKQIVEALHPTPAVCGMPKAVARDFLVKEEGYHRAYYAGYLGELNCNVELENTEETNLFVNLRCMNIEEDKVNLYIGCGITIDSDPTSEFIETVNKSSTMKKVLIG
ncbi:chorismate-binding protein [Myroides marinus]|uniref:chorismate-binding protein n=1 Tax=Myroides marinus TaxID=703342 RepID=UPI0025781E0F|nr:chorismate-binding protein [Myroides marinus]MDM1381164.1 chorismate-binding protein [Myroides marinus]MDM1405082.1 chorismate-binding protein [Myroides marinus]